jgi:hypothetical protein
MKKNLLQLIILLFVSLQLRGQSPAFEKVFDIFQTKCVSCHGGSNPTGGLNLQGSGASITERRTSVFNNLINVNPTNAAAVAKNYKRVYPGRADRSFLFHKINNGLEPTYALKSGEGDPMPRNNPSAITNTEKEIIRQWILFGATPTVVVPEERIRAFYDTVGRGLAAFETPPPPPAPNEGFQLKVGPFFLASQGRSGSEVEYFQKWELDLANDVEVNRIDHIISNYSHHFIIYNFNTVNDATKVNAGLRLNAFHSNINLVSAVQEKTDLKLPAKTAFKWEKNRVLDLNTHYINYSANHIYKAEAYINVYTQPVGTARQQMYAILIPNENINIPNNNQTITAERAFFAPTGRVYVWSLMGHTHKYGTSYKIFQRLANGQKGDLMYDAACPNGIPGCNSPFYDYQHIPMRYFEPLRPVNLNPGFVHQATWKNNGDKTVTFGATSDDEMMVMIAMYTLDTTGLARSRELLPLEGASVFPNPAHDRWAVSLPPSVTEAKWTLLDALGRVVMRQERLTGQRYEMLRGNLTAGLYIYRIEDVLGRVAIGKLFLE